MAFYTINFLLVSVALFQLASCCKDPFGLHCIADEWSCPLENFKQHVTDTRCIDSCCQCTVLEYSNPSDGIGFNIPPPMMQPKQQFFAPPPLFVPKQTQFPPIFTYGGFHPQPELLRSPIFASSSLTDNNQLDARSSTTLTQANQTFPTLSPVFNSSQQQPQQPTATIKIRMCRYSDLDSNACFIANSDLRCDYCLGGSDDSSAFSSSSSSQRIQAKSLDLAQPTAAAALASSPWTGSSTSTNFNYATQYGLGALSNQVPDYNVGYISTVNANSPTSAPSQVPSSRISPIPLVFNRPVCVRQSELGLSKPPKREDNNCQARKQFQLPTQCERYASKSILSSQQQTANDVPPTGAAAGQVPVKSDRLNAVAGAAKDIAASADVLSGRLSMLPQAFTQGFVPFGYGYGGNGGGGGGGYRGM